MSKWITSMSTEYDTYLKISRLIGHIFIFSTKILKNKDNLMRFFCFNFVERSDAIWCSCVVENYLCWVKPEEKFIAIYVMTSISDFWNNIHV